MSTVVARGAAPVLAALLLLVPAAGPAAANPAPDIGAEGAVLWEPATETVIHGDDELVGRPMASLTKIMTVLLALEASGPDELVTISDAAAEIGRTPGGATLHLQAGQQVPMGELLAGLVLHSGNDASVAVAEHVAGSEEAFVAAMNERADELDMADTHFVNSSGLTDDPDHRASPMDLARLAEVAMREETFAELARRAEFSGEHVGDFVNRNELLGSFDGATGVKTGYTSLAGLCLVASASRDGRDLYAVVLDSDDRFGDAAALLEHGFTDHRVVELGADGPVVEYRWADATVDLVAARPLALTVPIDAPVVRRVRTVPYLERPVTAGAGAGEASLLVGGRPEATGALEVAEDVAPADVAEPAAAAGGAVQDALRGLARLWPADHDL